MELWVSQAVAGGLPLSDQILQEKGLEFAKNFNIEDDNLRCSNGWVYKFKKRIGIHKITLHGEANSAPIADLADERFKLQQILANYDPENIYNADETGLFYRMEPNQTLSTSSTADSGTNETDDVEIIDNLPDQQRMIVENCINLLDALVTTEETLSDEQIISLVNTEDGESSDESDEEIPRVQLKEAKHGLETAIRYIEQQSDGAGIDFNDL
ncbi:9579_t:CDS:2, partial [Paraglomus brasilianum]